VRATIPRPARFAVAGLVAAGLAGAAPVAVGAGAPATGVRIDKRFGGGRGYVTTPIAGTTALAYGAIITRAGDIVVAGQASPPSGNGQVVVARYLPNGKLDRSFASGGIFKSNFPTKAAPFIANAVAQDKAGRFVVAGGYGEGSMLVLRLTRNGRLDPTFGPNHKGFATVDLGGVASSLVLQPNGGILLGGSNLNVPGRPFVVVRLTQTGILDRTFGQRGIVESLFWNAKAASGATVSSLTTTRGGTIIAAGHIDYIGGTGPGKAGYGTAGVFELTPGGRPVQSFGTAGHVQVTFYGAKGVPQSWYPCKMVAGAQGRITVTGGGSAPRDALFTARLTPRGALDRSYGAAHNGRSVVPGVGGNAITTCGALSTPGGGLTVAVQSKLARLLPGGRPDQRFARGGVFSIAKPKNVFVNAVLSAGTGRVVLAGSAGNAIYIARYLVPPTR
jgi:uncharacterized delta-60 repeat protein